MSDEPVVFTHQVVCAKHNKLDPPEYEVVLDQVICKKCLLEAFANLKMICNVHTIKIPVSALQQNTPPPENVIPMETLDAARPKEMPAQNENTTEAPPAEA